LAPTTGCFGPIAADHVDRRLEMNCGLSRMGNFDARLPLVTFSGRATRRFEADHRSTNGASSWDGEYCDGIGSGIVVKYDVSALKNYRKTDSSNQLGA
jgi:hypothetical protein